MGDMFEKATRTVKEVGESVIGSAKNLGTSIYTTSKEQGEIAGMKIQQSVINKRLDESYAKIGKRYVEYINNSNGGEVFDISDILDEMKDDMQKLEEIAMGLKEKELQAKKLEKEKQHKKALDAYESQKAKLDKALDLDIISEQEYQERIAICKKKYENYEMIQKIDMQLQMGIISKEEHAAKINNILNQ